MCVCKNVCGHVCEHTCMHVYVHMCVCARAHVCAHTHMHAMNIWRLENHSQVSVLPSCYTTSKGAASVIQEFTLPVQNSHHQRGNTNTPCH